MLFKTTKNYGVSSHHRLQRSVTLTTVQIGQDLALSILESNRLCFDISQTDVTNRVSDGVSELVKVEL